MWIFYHFNLCSSLLHISLRQPRHTQVQNSNSPFNSPTINALISNMLLCHFIDVYQVINILIAQKWSCCFKGFFGKLGVQSGPKIQYCVRRSRFHTLCHLSPCKIGILCSLLNAIPPEGDQDFYLQIRMHFLRFYRLQKRKKRDENWGEERCCGSTSCRRVFRLFLFTVWY